MAADKKLNLTEEVIFLYLVCLDFSLYTFYGCKYNNNKNVGDTIAKVFLLLSPESICSVLILFALFFQQLNHFQHDIRTKSEPDPCLACSLRAAIQFTCSLLGIAFV